MERNCRVAENENTEVKYLEIVLTYIICVNMIGYMPSLFTEGFKFLHLSCWETACWTPIGYITSEIMKLSFQRTEILSEQREMFPLNESNIQIKCR